MQTPILDFSKEFTIARLIKSANATRYGIDNNPKSQDIRNNGARLSLVLDALQKKVDVAYPNKRIIINSGYRNLKVNQLAGGSETSDHMKFCAADIELDGVCNYEFACFIRDNLEGYKQIIQEFGEWVHLAIPEHGVKPLLKLTTAKMGVVAGKRKAIYTNGLSKL